MRRILTEKDVEPAVRGGSVYAAVILACDVGRWRSGLKLRWLARRSARR